MKKTAKKKKLMLSSEKLRDLAPRPVTGEKLEGVAGGSWCTFSGDHSFSGSISH